MPVSLEIAVESFLRQDAEMMLEMHQLFAKRPYCYVAEVLAMLSSPSPWKDISLATWVILVGCLPDPKLGAGLALQLVKLNKHFHRQGTFAMVGSMEWAAAGRSSMVLQ